MADSEYGSIFSGFNLAIHEGGYLFFMWFGSDFLTVAGGTFLQCICLILKGIMFYRQRDFFMIGIACFWLGTTSRTSRPTLGRRCYHSCLPFRERPSTIGIICSERWASYTRIRSLGAPFRLPASSRWERVSWWGRGCFR